MVRKPVPTYPLELALEYTAGIIRQHGYVSKKDASQSGKKPTSDILRTLLTGPAVAITQDDGVKAQVALAWLTALASSTAGAAGTSFDASMASLTVGGYRNVVPGMITKSDFGFVACVWATMEREVNWKKKQEEIKAASADSEFMGKIKKRAEFFVKLTGKKYSDYTGCYVYNVKDRKGNLGVFFSSDSDLAEVNECFLAKMTPKRHNVSKYHGGKETVFNRVVVVQNVGVPGV